jgi:putative sigma-54 modulation protein
MNVEISFRNLEHTPALDELIRKKSERLSKHFTDGANINWTCWTDKHEHTTSLKINDKTKEFFAKAASDSLYKSVDLVISKVVQQIEHDH